MSSTTDSTSPHNIFAGLPQGARSELFETLAQSAHVHIERIVSSGQASPATGWFDQDRNEWVMLLKGAAVLVFENAASVSLTPGDYLTISAHTKHRVQWSDPDTETVWLAVHY